MAKIVIEDIRKQRQSLREVLPSNADFESRLNQRRAHLTPPEDFGEEFETSSWPSWFVIFGLIVVMILGVGYFVAPIFTRVTVTIKPKEVTTSVNQIVVATKIPAAGSGLVFTVLPTVEKSISQTVAANGSKRVENKATAKIRISNTYSKTAQKLVANTRFSTADGKIYRITEAISVPGMTSTGPGTLDVAVAADKAGVEGNGPAADLTIPGFAKSPQFTKITAKALTPFSGGFIGMIKSVDPATETKVKSDLTDKIKQELLAEVKKQVPAGSVVYQNAIVLNYEIGQTPVTGSSTDQATFTAKGSATAPVFNAKEMSAYIANQTVTDFKPDQAVLVANLQDLTFSLASSSADWVKADSINGTISGQAHIVWEINRNNIAKELAGHAKADYSTIFKKYGDSITEALVTFRPPWARSFPADPAQISVELPPLTK